MDDGFNINHAMQGLQGHQVDRTIAEFFTQPVHLEAKSRDEGRPIYEDREFVRIIIPGNRGSVVVQPVGDEHRQRHAVQYEAFKKGLAAISEGTPLGDWPPISRSMALEFAHFNVLTVEHLAGLNDVQLQHMPMGTRELVKAAKVFLEVAAHGTGPLIQLSEKNTRLEAQVEQQQGQMQEMAARLAALESAKGAKGQ
jgi:hypothetical protein